MENHTEEVDQHEILFTKPLQLFKSSPFNDVFTETRLDVIHPIPNTAYSEVYTFKRHGNSVGLMKTSGAKLSVDLSIRDGARALQANAELYVPPVPLRTLWKTKELKINENLVTPADNFNYITSYLNFLTRETPAMYQDSKQVNCSYLDTGNQMEVLGGNNIGSLNRRALTNNIGQVHLIDQLDLACFSEGGGEIFLPTAFKIEVRLTRAAMNIACMGVDHGDMAVANGRISLENFE